MKNFFSFSLLVFASLGFSLAATPSQATPRVQSTVSVGDPVISTAQQAYDYAINVVGVTPQDALRVVLGFETVTAPQAYLRDELARLGYQFPVPVPVQE